MDQMPIRGEPSVLEYSHMGENNECGAQRHYSTDLKLVEQMHWDIPLRLDKCGRAIDLLSLRDAFHSSREFISWM